METYNKKFVTAHTVNTPQQLPLKHKGSMECVWFLSNIVGLIFTYGWASGSGSGDWGSGFPCEGWAAGVKRGQAWVSMADCLSIAVFPEGQNYIKKKGTVTPDGRNLTRKKDNTSGSSLHSQKKKRS